MNVIKAILLTAVVLMLMGLGIILAPIIIALLVFFGVAYLIFGMIYVSIEESKKVKKDSE